jgi:hypothetical protein
VSRLRRQDLAKQRHVRKHRLWVLGTRKQGEGREAARVERKAVNGEPLFEQRKAGPLGDDFLKTIEKPDSERLTENVHMQGFRNPEE